MLLKILHYSLFWVIFIASSPELKVLQRINILFSLLFCREQLSVTGTGYHTVIWGTNESHDRRKLPGGS